MTITDARRIFDFRWTVLAAGVLGTGLLGALLMLGTGHSCRFEMLAEGIEKTIANIKKAAEAGAKRAL